MSHLIRSLLNNRPHGPKALSLGLIRASIVACALLCAVTRTAPAIAGEKAAAVTDQAKSGDRKRPAGTNRSGTRTGKVRTLETITIEGEIAVPQVLFITARDYRRYRDGLGSKFRITTMGVARSVDLPTRLRIVTQHKEEEK